MDGKKGFFNVKTALVSETNSHPLPLIRENMGNDRSAQCLINPQTVMFLRLEANGSAIIKIQREKVWFVDGSRNS